MNKRLVKQIQDDYREILQSEAGKRILGGIFKAAGLNKPVSMKSENQQGQHDLALCIANTVREVNIYGVAECEKAYAELERSVDNGGRPDDRGDIGDYGE